MPLQDIESAAGVQIGHFFELGRNRTIERGGLI
ncbi:MAG: hypothetical protein ACI8UP_000152 [Porticoccaceae bacterium]|jgi:hypothetical protein